MSAMPLALVAILAVQVQDPPRVEHFWAVEVRAISGTVLDLRREKDGPWSRVRIVALRESTQPAIRRKALKVTADWLDAPKDDVISYTVFDLGHADAVWPNFTVWRGNADKEQVTFEIGTVLVGSGLAKLDRKELSSLPPYPRVSLQNSEALARRNRSGMWSAAPP